MTFKCTCGLPEERGVVHRHDLPCYIPTMTTSERVNHIMNTKIEALAYEHGLFSQGTPDQWDCEHLEKFATAIIAQCIDIIETYRIPVGNSRSGELAAEWTWDALVTIRNEIRERFDYHVPSA